MALRRGTKYNDILNGTKDDDLFAGLGGNDTLNGGGGMDTAWYSGNVSGYAFSSIGGRLVIRDTNAADGADGRDSLRQIETLQFSNCQLQVTGSEFRVNTYTIGYQNDPSIRALADGGYVISWTSEGQDGSGTGIYAQRYDARGKTVGTEFRVNTYTTGAQTEPSITALADGCFVVSWTSDGQDGSNDGIYAQRYDINAAAVGTEFRVNTYTTDFQGSSSITALADGGFVVTWTSNGQDVYDVYAQRYDINAAAVGAEFRVNTYTTDSQGSSSIAALADGGFVITWSSRNQEGNAYGIYAKRYDINAAAVGPEFRVNTYTNADQRDSSIATLADGGFVITWSSEYQDGSGWGVYAQRYDINANAVGAEFRVNTYTTDYQDEPSVTALADGSFVVTWSSQGQDGYYDGIYGQRYDVNAVAVGAEFRVNTYTNADQSDSSIAALAGGGFVVTWTSNGQDGSFLGIYAQRYDSSGNAIGMTLTGSADADIINLDPGHLLTVDGAGGDDTLNGSSGDDELMGGAGNDTLTGNAGNDILDGGSGDDSMFGGADDDDYFVDSSRDVLTEFAEAGNDSVFASVTWTLAENFENLRLTGSSSINATGNTLGNYLEGNTGNNILNGGGGADLLAGGKGNDTYIVDSIFDLVSEDAASGTDTIQSSVAFTLPDNVENLTLTGLSAIAGTGNGLNNSILGNSGKNVLQGGDGNDRLSGQSGDDRLLGGSGGDRLYGGIGLDTLTGGSGGDIFVFDTELTEKNNDVITDFVSSTDKIWISQKLAANAGSVGTLSSSEFVAMKGHSATDSHHILYDTSSGGLYYNADGAGPGVATLIATLETRPSLKNTDIVLV